MRKKNLNLMILIGILLGCIMISTSLNIHQGKIEANSSSPEIDKLPTQTNLFIKDEVSKHQFNGTGASVKTDFYANISKKVTLETPYKEAPGYKYFDLSINTDHQNVTQTNLTFSDVLAQNTTYVIEDYPENFVADARYFYAMSIKIPTACKLRQIQLFVQDTEYIGTPPGWNISIFNATRDIYNNLYVRPDSYTGISITQTALPFPPTPAAHWQNFTFPDVQLNISNTYIDANGFAYYFFLIKMPFSTLYYRFLYYSYDDEFVDKGWAYYGNTTYIEYIGVDFCLKVDLAPLSQTPTPADIRLSVKNPSRPPITNLTIEKEYNYPGYAARNTENYSYTLAQNFTLTDYGTIESISFYVEVRGSINAIVVAIFPDNESGSRPYLDGNYLYDLNTTFYPPSGMSGWFNFTMDDKPNLKPGKYWWIFAVDGTGAVILNGSAAAPDDAVALNITTIKLDGNTTQTQETLDYDFANIIYIQYGRDYYNVTDDWISIDRYIPNIYGEYHFEILTRWIGETAFNVTYTIELEKNQYITPIYYADFSEYMIRWNISITPAFPSTELGKIINISLPLDWNILYVLRNGQDHGKNNWSIIAVDHKKILSVFNASNADWLIWCNSSVYSLNFTIQKWVQGSYIPADNATIYDQIRVEVNITNQTNGICYLNIFYPDQKSSFSNQTPITNELNYLYWFPETDPAATGGNYTFIVHWANGTEVGYTIQYFWFTPLPANVTVISTLPTPFVDDISKSLIIQYNDSRGVNITGATVYAELGGVSLDWEDLYGRTLNIRDKGKYRIKLNTTGLDANRYYNLTGWIQKEGYENVTFPAIKIFILPVPTALIPS
ncbi:MAG: hypothetical protein ACTSYB_00655, partial [Candidatus Helarchaeota archaeon]